MVGDVDVEFGHDLDGVRMEAMSFDAGRVGFEVVAEGAGETLSHLTATGIAGAQEEDFGFGGHDICLWLGSCGDWILTTL